MGSAEGLNRGHSTQTDDVDMAGLEASEDDAEACSGLKVYDDANSQYIPMSDGSSSISGSGECNSSHSQSSWHSRKRTHSLPNGEVVWDVAGNLCEWVKEDLKSSHSHVVDALSSNNYYISQWTSTSGGDENSYPLSYFDYDLSSGSIVSENDVIRRTLKNLFGPVGDYLTTLNTNPDSQTLSTNTSQPGDDTDSDSGSYHGNLGSAQFEFITNTVYYEICRGGNSGRTSEGVVAGVFAVRMNPSKGETHAFRCVYHPQKRNPAWNPDPPAPPQPPQPPPGQVTTPEAPGQLEAQARDEEVILSWSVPASDGGTPIRKYQYQYKIAGGNFNGWVDISNSDIIDTQANGSNKKNYTVDTLINGTTYTFQLRAVNDQGEGAVAEITAIPEINVTAPEAPTSVNALPGNTVVTLSWVAPINDGGSAITKYQYQYQEENGSWGLWMDIDDSAPPNGKNKESYTVPGLSNDTEYTFQMRAVNNSGIGSTSLPTKVTPVAALTAPSPPRNLRATTGEDTQVTLVWEVSATDGGSEITEHQYKILNITDGGTWSQWETIPTSAANETNATGFVVSNLTNGKTYSFEVRAINNEGNSNSSNPQDATPQAPAQAPTAIQVFNVESGDGHAILSWEAVDNGGSRIEEYQYQKKEESNAWEISWTNIPNSGEGDEDNETSYTVSPLTNGTLYTFKIRARNAVGPGTASSEEEVRPSAATAAPTIPLNLKAVGNNAQVTLEWEASNDRGSPISEYQYRKKEASEVWGSSHIWVSIANSAPPNGANVESYIVPSLTNGTKYTFQVRAVNGIGFSDPSADIEATPRLPFPSAPNLRGEHGNAQVTLSWTAPDSDGGSGITGYKYQRQTNGGSGEGWQSIVDSSPNSSPIGVNATSYTVPNLANGTEYTFQVRAVNDNGDGETSDPIDLTPATRPDAPTNLRATAGDTQVDLVWEASVSDGGSEVTKHQYQQSEGSNSFGGWEDIINSGANDTIANATTFTVGSLINGRTYNFRVRAVNDEGESEASNPEGAIPEVAATAPSVPQNFEAQRGNGQVTLVWEASSDSGNRLITSHEYQKRSVPGSWSSWEPIPDSGSSGNHALRFIVSNLTNGTRYRFKIRAVNEAGLTSSATEPEEVKPAAKPTVPTSLTATLEGTQVVLNWGTPDSDGGIDITSYEYRQQESGEGWEAWIPVPDSGVVGNNKNSYTITTNFANGTTYNFEVRAVNDAGESEARGGATVEFLVPFDTCPKVFRPLREILRWF